MADRPPGRALLEISGLTVSYDIGGEPLVAVSDADLKVSLGESVAIVGESGSGKSTLAQSVLGLLAGNAAVVAGEIRFDGRDLLKLTPAEYREVRGRQIGLVPQDPMTNLDPLMRVGRQVSEAPFRHGIITRRQRRPTAVASLTAAGLPMPRHNAQQYPIELSGGMRQRVLIAAASALQPRLFIADEPTSALDVTIQKRILDQFESMISQSHAALLFITHDLALAAERAQRVVVMYRGRIVEQGPASDVLTAPEHEYTRRLVSAAPSLSSVRYASATRQPDSAAPRIAVDGLVKTYRHRDESGKRGRLRALDDVSVAVARGEALGIVGESGSGKSTFARAVLRMLRLDAGHIRYDGQDVQSLSGSSLRAYRQRVQPVFQDPAASLNPAFTVQDAICEPLVIQGVGSGATRARRALGLLDRVGLPADLRNRRTAALSGGQKQRVAIARALACEPETLICDEIVSALDVLVQAQILQLLAGLKQELDLTCIFISHDLAVVRQIADTVIVMHQGRVVERGPCEDLFSNPQQEYTKELVSAIPGHSGTGNPDHV
jgi:peptide/nickel transport system ATP-binding protein